MPKGRPLFSKRDYPLASVVISAKWLHRKHFDALVIIGEA
jgi:hypothetical protein